MYVMEIRTLSACRRKKSGLFGKWSTQIGKESKRNVHLLSKTALLNHGGKERGGNDAKFRMCRRTSRLRFVRQACL